MKSECATDFKMLAVTFVASIIEFTLKGVLIAWAWNHFVASRHPELSTTTGVVVGLLLIIMIIKNKADISRKVSWEGIGNSVAQASGEILFGAMLIGALALVF